MWGPRLQGENILLGVIKDQVIQENRTLRAEFCGAYFRALGDQRKEIPMRTERARKGFFRRGGFATTRRVGSFGWMKRTCPVWGTWWVKVLRQEGAQYVPRTIGIPRNCAAVLTSLVCSESASFPQDRSESLHTQRSTSF